MRETDCSTLLRHGHEEVVPDLFGGRKGSKSDAPTFLNLYRLYVCVIVVAMCILGEFLAWLNAALLEFCSPEVASSIDSRTYFCNYLHLVGCFFIPLFIKFAELLQKVTHNTKSPGVYLLQTIQLVRIMAQNVYHDAGINVMRQAKEYNSC
jgi:hypothetical protein